MTDWKDMAGRWRSLAERLRSTELPGPMRAELYALINRHDAVAQAGKGRVDRMEACVSDTGDRAGR